MRKKLQRGLCLILCVVMAFSCMAVPVGAVTPAIAALAPLVKEAVGAWLVGTVVEDALQAFKDWIDGKTMDPSGYIAPIGALCTAQKTEVTEDRLRELAYEWNATCSAAVGFTVDVVDHTLDTGEVYRIIAVRRGYVVTNTATQYCLADGVSRILYCDATTELSGRWAPEEDTTGRHLLNRDTLFNLATEVNGLIRLVGVHYEIYRNDGSVYCNVAGRRFSCIYESDKAAVNQDRPTTGGTIIEGDTITNIENTYNEDNDTIVNNDYSQDIDIENMQQALPGGTINNIDNLIYDENTKTYYVDSHDVTNNVTNNFLYEYHINYTSITYIGQTEEYNKRYELYYQLPDGRDSADLTPEELEQLNVDIDVIPYVRYSDNMDVRSLYHFDGDTRDSSYWNYATDFEWITGASLTYMESGAFNGALYLDENAHEFKMTLPVSADATGDWTLQWRYYQSHTEAPVNDSTVYVGDVPVFKLDGRALYTPAGKQIAIIPTGSWNEFCIIRSGSVLYYYVNGVFYVAADDYNAHSNVLRFQFGDQQQTYKYFDELRFVRGAVYDAGKNYTPTAVPHDSNLTLVLPTGTEYVVDEVLNYTPSENNLLARYGLDDWGVSAFSSSCLYPMYYPFCPYQNGYVNAEDFSSLLRGYPVAYDRDHISLLTSSEYDGRLVRFGGTNFVKKSDRSSFYTQPDKCISLPLFYNVLVGDLEDESYPYVRRLVGDWSADKTYTFSTVLNDGSYSSITFRIVPENTVPDRDPYDPDDRWYCDVLHVVQNSEIRFSVEQFGLVVSEEIPVGDNSFYGCIPLTAICFNTADGDAYIRYMELVEGDSPEFKIDYETAVYTAGELEHVPTLAVRTDVNITDYQIGGVRPSVPEKGQVWALVEKGYITSLQVYNGSVWLNADGRIWTGSRWIPASSYNVITLQDMYDIVDATEDYEYIYTESGFWDWLQRAWQDLISRLDQIISGLGSGSSGSDCQHVYDSAVDREVTCTEFGHVVYTCSLCGHSHTELIDPLGHDWVVTDRVESESTISPVVITRQPVNGVVALNTTVNIRVNATGDGLTYKWYIRNAGSSVFTLSSSVTGNTYSTQLTKERNGRQLYCVITDKYGNSVQTDIVIMCTPDYVIPEPVVPPIVITTQPTHVTVAAGENAVFHVDAAGEGLRYQWYYRDGHDGHFKPSNVKESSYTVTMTTARNGRQVYCMITDSNGNSVQSFIVMMIMAGEPAHDVLTCSRCNSVGTSDGDSVIGPGVSVDDGLNFHVLLVDAIDGAWSFVVGVFDTGFGGLSGFVDGFSVLPDFFALYKPSNQIGVLGVQHYKGADIWD